MAQASATDLKKLFDTQQGYVRALPTRLTTPIFSPAPRDCYVTNSPRLQSRAGVVGALLCSSAATTAATTAATSTDTSSSVATFSAVAADTAAAAL